MRRYENVISDGLSQADSHLTTLAQDDKHLVIVAASGSASMASLSALLCVGLAIASSEVLFERTAAPPG